MKNNAPVYLISKLRFSRDTKNELEIISFNSSSVPNIDTIQLKAVKRKSFFKDDGIISLGTEDLLYESVKKNITFFEEKKIHIKPYIVSGGHTWMNCKIFLATTLREIFK